MTLPKQYFYLEEEYTTLMVKAWVSIYGTVEIPGLDSNPKIMSWAKELGISAWYTDDDIPWCGVAMAWVAKQANKKYPKDFARALSWKDFGRPVTIGMLGDVFVYTRNGGGHVQTYVGEDKDCYHFIGANQQNRVNIVRKNKKIKPEAIRRPLYNIQPEAVCRIILPAVGQAAGSEV